jgi:micrococcal nuclease
MYKYKASVERVVDGDTVDCIIDLGFDVKIHERVRLSGIDTPEIRTKDLQEKKLGFEAKEFVENSFDEKGNTFVIETEYKRGKYGRTIGTITFDDGSILNEMLVSEGHAEKINY